MMTKQKTSIWDLLTQPIRNFLTLEPEHVEQEDTAGDIEFEDKVIKPNPEEWYFLLTKKRVTSHPLWEVSQNVDLSLENITGGRLYFRKDPTISFRCPTRVQQVGHYSTTIELKYDMWGLITKEPNEDTYISHRYEISEEDYDEVELLASQDIIRLYNPVTEQTVNLKDYADLVRFMVRLQYKERKHQEEEAKQKAMDLIKQKEDEIAGVKEDIKQIYLNENLNTVHQVQDPSQAELERIDYMNLEKILTEFKIGE